MLSYSSGSCASGFIFLPAVKKAAGNAPRKIKAEREMEMAPRRPSVELLEDDYAKRFRNADTRGGVFRKCTVISKLQCADRNDQKSTKWRYWWKIKNRIVDNNNHKTSKSGLRMLRVEG